MTALLLNRQKVLLCVIEELNKEEKWSKLMVEKNLFLLGQEENMSELVKFYHFFPYKYGPYSYTSYVDLKMLHSKSLIDEREAGLTLKGKSVVQTLNPVIQQKVLKTASRFKSNNEIKRYVYDTYPWYTVRSNNPQMKVESKKPAIFSIGYEGKDIDEFLNMLLLEGIEVLVDVRYNPFSMNFSFTKGKLKHYLESVGIAYVHLPQLGIRGELRKNLSSQEDYANLFAEYKKSAIPKMREELRKLVKLGEKKRIAVMCFEHSKDMCHRGVISGYFESVGVEVMHV